MKAELFPDVFDEDYSDEQALEAAEEEGNYYSYIIRLVETEEEEKEFSYLDLVYDGEHIV